MCGYQAKIVCVWQSDNVCIVQIVANGFLLILQVEEHRIEGHKENDGRDWVTLENSSVEFECV
jgi:hypothetical protein